MPPQTLKLAPNVPVIMEVKFCDVYPNDPAKNNGKGYGSSVSLRGFVDGEDVRVYPKGFTDRTLRTLISADVIELGTYDDDPEEKYSIPVLDGKNVQLLMEQPAGERYPAFVARNLSGVTTSVKPGRETPKGTPTDDGYMQALIGDPPSSLGRGPLQVMTPAARSTTAVDRMRACIGAALTLAEEASDLMQGPKFNPEDIRAIAVSMFIDGYGR